MSATCHGAATNHSFPAAGHCGQEEEHIFPQQLVEARDVAGVCTVMAAGVVLSRGADGLVSVITRWILFHKQPALLGWWWCQHPPQPSVDVTMTPGAFPSCLTTH